MGVETTPPKISIVTPSYNQGKYLEKTILSVLEQNYPNLEYIIIDGGSTDESVEIIKKYADRLTYWVSEPDRGQSHAINKGFERATGEIFGWLNSDDWYHAGALQAVAEAFAANPEVGAVVGAGEMVDEEGHRLIYKAPSRVDTDFLYHWLDEFFWQPSTFFIKDAWLRCGPLDEDIHFAMDLDLWLRIAGQFPFSTTSDNLSASLKHEGAKTTEHSSRAVFDAHAVIVRNGGESIARQGVERYCAYLSDREQDRMKEILELKRELHDMDQSLNERNIRLGATIDMLNTQTIRTKELESQLKAIYNSFSWKITSSLRWLHSKLNRLKG